MKKVELNSAQLATYVATAKKRTRIRAFVSLKGDWQDKISFGDCKAVYGNGLCVVDGDKGEFLRCVDIYGEYIKDYIFDCVCANSGVGLADISDSGARIEPFAVVREKVALSDSAVVMMGAVLNIGCVVGERTMIDMNAVIGSNAQVGNDCHVGAGAVLAGVLEPIGATPVVIEDDVTLGANSVVLEGVRVGKGCVVGAGAVVTKNLPPFSVAVGCPAKIIKTRDEITESKTQRNLQLF